MAEFNPDRIITRPLEYLLMRWKMWAAGIVVVLTSLVVPVTVWAQSAIAGGVRDPSGAVLPGATVEAVSPVLIEKVRSVITDEAGQYKIVDLLVIPSMAAASLNVPLTPGNTQVLDRLNQLDLSLSKSFHTGTKRLQARFDVFNSLNKAPVLVVRSSNFGTAAYLQPSSVLDGRTFRVGMQMQF
jgi:hypothetical protein